MTRETSADAVAGPMLGAYAAKQCPVRLFRSYDPTETAVAAPPDHDLQRLFDDGISYEAAIAEQIVALHDPAQVAVIPGRETLGHDDRRAMTDAALEAATPIIIGALMQPDPIGRRRGEIDVLVATGRSVRSTGRPEYRPIDVKSHRSTIDTGTESGSGTGTGTGSGSGVVGVSVHDLRLLAPTAVFGAEPRYREDDCLQLAHYHRLLQHLGHAEPDEAATSGSPETGAWETGASETGAWETGAWGGIIGSEGLVAWFDLERPQFSTLTPQEVDGSITFHQRRRDRKRTALDRYDFEFAFRTRVVDAAVARTSRDDAPIVRPVKVGECERCDWRDVCDADLREADDVSLVNGVGYPEWRVHRFVGIDTVDQLATLDPATVADRYSETPLKTKNIVAQIRCAQSLVAGKPILRDDWDPASMPRGDVEVDLDMENDGRVYLWGARLSKVPTDWPDVEGTYRPFVSFDPLDDDAEARLARQLWDWLDDLRNRAGTQGRSLRIYTYSSVEATQLRRILRTSHADRLDALLSSDQWVDLLPVMRSRYWSNWGHGLKVMATAVGFAWRDDDPDGWASVGWYQEALAGVRRSENIARLLAYNEDDCRATAALRADDGFAGEDTEPNPR